MAKRKVATTAKTPDQRWDEIEKELADMASLWMDWRNKPDEEVAALKARNDALVAEQKALREEFLAMQAANRESQKLRGMTVQQVFG
jgi:hypothetical protein